MAFNFSTHSLPILNFGLSLPVNVDLPMSSLPPGTANLSCYVREAVLPQLTCSKRTPEIPLHHKSHRNVLSVRPERYRTFQCMSSLRDEVFEPLVTSWVDENIPHRPLGEENGDSMMGESLTIQCEWFDVPRRWLRPASDITSFVPWILQLPLETIERVMHLSNPETLHWRFDTDERDDVDGDIFKYCLWTLPNDDPTPDPEILMRGVVMAYQPPWILSPKDMEAFVNCRTFPSPRKDSPLNSAQRLWAKIWDLCARKQTQWFILSSYNDWVFGAFSRGRTRAFTSTIFYSHDRSPSILECLTYWLASAMRLTGGWQIPEVPEPVENVVPDFSMHPHANIRIPVALSDSSYDGENDDAGSSASFERELSPVVSEWPSLRHAPPLQRPPNETETRNRVHSWMSIPEDRDSREFIPPPSPAMSTCSFTSTSTVRDLGNNAKGCGHWLVGIPENEFL